MRENAAVPWHESLVTFSKVVKEKGGMSGLTLVVPFLDHAGRTSAHSYRASTFPSLIDHSHRLFMPSWALPAFLIFSHWGFFQASPKSLQRHRMFTNIQKSQWVKYHRVSMDAPLQPWAPGVGCMERAVLIPCLLSHSEPKFWPISVSLFAAGSSAQAWAAQFFLLCFVRTAAPCLPWGLRGHPRSS